MTRVDVAMRSRIVTARRETTEETTRRRIARGVDVARASSSRADARCGDASRGRLAFIRQSSTARGVEDARPKEGNFILV